MNGWAKLPKTHRKVQTRIHTNTEPDSAEIGSAGILMLLVALNHVVEITAMMRMMDCSGDLAKQFLLYLWKKIKDKITKGTCL